MPPRQEPRQSWRRSGLGTCSKCDDHNNPCVCRAACDCEGHQPVRIVFNAREWVEAGHDQPEGNAQFWQPARIIEEIDGSGLLPDGSRERIATVEWPDGRRSAGHFVHLMEEVPNAR